MNSQSILEDQTSLKGKNWQYSEIDKNVINYLEELFNINKITATIVAKRVKNKSEYINFINPSLKNNLPNPYVLYGMKECVALFFENIKKGYQIGLLSDYDVDGATSAAIIYKYFKQININLEVYIPDRLDEGYGISKKAIDFFESKNINLMVTLDCGTNEKANINYAKEKNIEVIVIDHHEVKENTNANVIINPKQKNDTSKLNYLATVGVSFLFLVAMHRKLKENNYFTNFKEPDLRRLLDLVALGTVCDLVPLTSINRLYVKKGINILKNKHNLGLKVLKEKLNIEKNIESQDLGYYIGPCINAAGRIGKSEQGYNLLIAEDKIKASLIADELIKNNKERKAIENLAFNQAESIINKNHKVFKKNKYILVYNNNWHPGIIGIIASRLIEKYNVPAFVISCSSQLARGSIRSVKGVNVNDLLDYLKEKNIILSGGGHAMAGGFEMYKEHINKLDKQLIKKMLEYNSLGNKSLDIDIISEIGQLDFESIQNLNKIAPFGIGNAEPRFLFKNLRVSFFKEIGKNQEHISCVLEDIYSCKIKAIFFNADSFKNSCVLKEYKEFHVVGKVKINEWNKKENIQLIIEDIMLS